MNVHVGTSGWAYDDWRHGLFHGVPQRVWFETVVGEFGTVELNVTFYRLPAESVFAGWRRRAPDGAVIAVKASRYLTHVRRLAEPQQPVARLLARAERLEAVLGPVLLQLPPDMAVDVDALDTTLACFAQRVRVAVEPRHGSWWTPGVRRTLERHDAALVWADRRGPITPFWQTASWCYLRFHEGRAGPWPRYGRRAIDTWAARIAALDGDPDVFAYFNNDQGGAAVADAVALRERLRRHRLTVVAGPTSRLS